MHTDTAARRAHACRPVILALALLASCLPALGAGFSLDDKIEAIIERAQLGGASVGVAVVEVDSGRVIADYRGSTPMMPASNMKLLTSGAALLTLGDDFTFRTELLREDADVGTRLILRGSGDPGFGDPELLDKGTPSMDVDGLLARIAAAAHKRLDAPVAELVIDDRVFDDQRIHDSWPTDQLNRWYCAEVSGLTFHTNVLTVYLNAVQNAQPSTTISPEAPWIELDNRARSIFKGQPTAWIARPRPANDFTIYGNVRGRLAIDVALADPADFAGRVLARSLDRAGVTFTTPTPKVRRAELSESFDNATPLVAITTSLADVLRRCNADSHNLYAECLLKRIGHDVTGEPGSWVNGAAVVRMLLAERLGPDHATSTTIVDGSGLSRDNRVTPETLAAWLAAIARDPDHSAAFLASLATPGEGTLTSRFRDKDLFAEVHAKSGYLRGVYSLSGYLVDPRTHDPAVAFSIILNDVPEGSVARNAKPLHEAIVAAIDDWLEQQTPVTADFGG